MSESKHGVSPLLEKYGFDPSQGARGWARSLFGGLAGSQEMGQLANFLRHLSICTSSGILITDAVQVSARGGGPRLEAVGKIMVEGLEEGYRLSAVLASFGGLFPQNILGLIRIGEESGGLVQALGASADLLERRVRTRRKLWSALVYPGLSFLIFLGLVMVLSLFLVPTFARVFETLNAPLPLPLHLLLTLSTLSSHTPVLVMLIPAGLFVLYSAGQLLEREDVREAMWSYGLSIPVLGPMLGEFLALELASGLFSLLRSGVVLTTALKLSQASASNPYLVRAVREMRSRVMNGDQLSEALEPEAWCPRVLPAMVAVGEESGKLERTLSSVIGYLEDSLAGRTEAFLSLLEPMMMAAMGLFAGVIILAMMGPIVSVLQTL